MASICEEQYYSELMDILNTSSISTVFQPIVSLIDGNIIGYEALSRGRTGSLLQNPDMLFRTAKKHNKVWEIELLCRTKAIENATNIPQDKKLFLNVDPAVIRDDHFERGLTRDFLLKNNVDPGCIIFEITEKTAVEDYKAFKAVLENYVEQGYKIAIDDTGAGYSGLKLLAETHPQYIKIDMDLIRNIDKDSFKQALLTNFLNFSEVTNIKIIAEGIETLDELTTLINMGIPYGQGYYLHKPHPGFVEINPFIKQQIVEINSRQLSSYFHNSKTEVIGNIVRHDVPIVPDTLSQDVKEIFDQNKMQGLVVTNENNEPIGLIMKNKFNERLATLYGVAIYMKRPVRLLMDSTPLIVDFNTPLVSVTKAAMARKESNLYDYIIITKDNKYYGITTVKRLLEHTTDLELNYARHLSPLTGLPGNLLIEKELSKIINSSRDYSILYLDIDNFKSYNDSYGFEKGDRIIELTSDIIQDNVKLISLNNYFIGHIGGDDFIVCLYSNDKDKIDEICQSIIAGFDKEVKDYYNEKDRFNGFITAINRNKTLKKFPIMTISIAVITNSNRRFVSVNHVSEIAAQVKKRCKAVKKSCYIRLDEQENVCKC